ncbi:MAG: NRAMP family divalent metal transporter [Acidimicrobiia bacterium]
MTLLPASPPAPKRRRFLRFAAVIAILGPGLIAANAGNDAGGIVTYASAGSQFQYRTLFICVLVIAALVAVQEMAARLGAYSGEGLMSLVREEFSLRIGAFVVVCLLVANLGLVVSEFAGIGAALEIFGVSRYISVPVAAVVILGVVLFGSYNWAERVFLAFSLVFLAYPVAMFLAGPDWVHVAKDTFIPHFVASRDFLLMAVALVGTTITPYMQLYQAAAVADRGIGPDEYPHERIDAVVGSLFAGFIFLSILIATGAAHYTGSAITSADQAAKALEPVAGSSAEALFAIGLLGASMLAAAIVPLSTAYGLAEAVGAERSVSRRFREAPLFLGLFAIQILVGAAVALIPVNLIDLLIGMQVLNGFITPVILVFLFILTNRSSAVGAAVNGPRFKVFAFVCVVVVSLLALTAFGVTVGQAAGLL